MALHLKMDYEDELDTTLRAGVTIEMSRHILCNQLQRHQQT